MKPEAERCGEEAALCSVIRLDRVKEEEEEEEEDVYCRGEGVGGKVSRARCQYGSVELRKGIPREQAIVIRVTTKHVTYDAKITSHKHCDATNGRVRPHPQPPSTVKQGRLGVTVDLVSSFRQQRIQDPPG
jgi:hypothetical protein